MATALVSGYPLTFLYPDADQASKLLHLLRKTSDTATMGLLRRTKELIVDNHSQFAMQSSFCAPDWVILGQPQSVRWRWLLPVFSHCCFAMPAYGHLSSGNLLFPELCNAMLVSCLILQLWIQTGRMQEPLRSSSARVPEDWFRASIENLPGREFAFAFQHLKTFWTYPGMGLSLLDTYTLVRCAARCTPLTGTACTLILVPSRQPSAPSQNAASTRLTTRRRLELRLTQSRTL
jgi:hypothetical protein